MKTKYKYHITLITAGLISEFNLDNITMLKKQWEDKESITIKEPNNSEFHYNLSRYNVMKIDENS